MPQPTTRLYQYLILIVSVLVLGACTTRDDPGRDALQPLNRVTANDLQVVTGQTVFVPAYSEIFHDNGNRTIDLTVTLAIHNTDAEISIIIQSVRYYDTEGRLVREYVDSPVALNPLGTAGFVVGANDKRGGFGANFIVEWVAEQSVHEPVIEAVMINTGNQQGLSMISSGRIISQINGD